MEETKLALYERCLKFVEQRIATAKTALQQAREASNDDTKSSAGDKYETSREMAQQDIDRNKRLLMDAEDNQRQLFLIKDLPTTEVVRNGSLVYTDNGNFFLSVSAGQLNLNGETFFAVSAVSPIGKAFLGKKVDEKIDFNGKKYLLKKII